MIESCFDAWYTFAHEVESSETYQFADVSSVGKDRGGVLAAVFDWDFGDDDLVGARCWFSLAC